MLSRKRFGSRCPPALCIYVLFFVFTSPPVWQSLCASDIPLPPLSPSYRHIAMKRNELHLLQAIFMANLAIYILETILREGMWLWSNKSDCYGEACGIYMYLCVIYHTMLHCVRVVGVRRACMFHSAASSGSSLSIYLLTVPMNENYCRMGWWCSNRLA